MFSEEFQKRYYGHIFPSKIFSFFTSLKFKSSFENDCKNSFLFGYLFLTAQNFDSFLFFYTFLFFSMRSIFYFLFLIFLNPRNLFLMRPLSGTMFGFRMLSSQDTLLPLPRIQERIQDTGGWKVLNIIQGIPQVENNLYI